MSVFAKLRDFITKDMRMSHVYQPVMLMKLLQCDNSATAEEIAAEILKYDPTQVEYYTQIVKKMVGDVLTNKRKITLKQGEHYSLVGLADLSADEKSELVALCRKKLEGFEEAHGISVFEHRRRGRRTISGSVRYEVLKRARFRCELCGVHDDHKWLEVDHINPRSLGGRNEIDNYQALCHSCNQAKGNTDDTDFRAQAESYGHREAGCAFCEVPDTRIVEENALAYVVRDLYPVTGMHTLVIPRRHVADYFGAYQAEVNAMNRLIQSQKEHLLKEDPEISGFNIGMNCGAVAGQTIFHCHLHLIPRRKDDVSEPRGGIRNLIPGKGNY